MAPKEREFPDLELQFFYIIKQIEQLKPCSVQSVKYAESGKDTRKTEQTSFFLTTFLVSASLPECFIAV